MRRAWAAALGVCLGVSWVYAEGAPDVRRSGRYELYISPQAHRIYVLDTQSGRMFQVVNYKEINKEILEEIPYVFGSNRLCTPSDYESSGERCFSKNYDYIKTLLDMRREKEPSVETSTPSRKTP